MHIDHIDFVVWLLLHFIVLVILLFETEGRQTMSWVTAAFVLELAASTSLSHYLLLTWHCLTDPFFATP